MGPVFWPTSSSDWTITIDLDQSPNPKFKLHQPGEIQLRGSWMGGNHPEQPYVRNVPVRLLTINGAPVSGQPFFFTDDKGEVHVQIPAFHSPGNYMVYFFAGLDNWGWRPGIVITVA